MTLPEYFIADLPVDAELSPGLLREACLTLRRNRNKYLAGRDTSDLVRILASVASNWLSEDDPFRGLALSRGPAETGFSRSTIARGLDEFFTEICRERLNQLIVQDLGHERRLDEMVGDCGEERSKRNCFARGPELMTHVVGGTLPNPVLVSMILGFLVRSAQIVKCASGSSFFPRLFAHSLYAVDSKLGACLEIVEWSGGSPSLEEIAFDQSDLVTATGTDQTLAAIRSRIPPGTRLLEYGHRISLAYVTEKGLLDRGVAEVAAKCAEDVAAWDQQGCLSPHVIYVESGGMASVEAFAQALAVALSSIQTKQPRGLLSTEEAADIARRRSVHQIRAANFSETFVWASDQSTAWTVVLEMDAQFQYSCLNRFVYVKRSSDETMRQLEPIRGKVSTVGLAAATGEAAAMSLALAKWGASRVCPVGKMQNPPLLWRHDGRPSLGDLVVWTDWERE